ncbi:MAG: zinc ribbon domain-containing protein [Lachnospiraceae bacterium]|nr:zinc ribbon domain-containing protein [Lachnospiraceae bacterium]
MKICLNCGDKLLDGAKKCPSCGAKAKDFPIVNSKDKERIEELIANVPHPKSGTPNWVGRVETKQGIWAKDEQKKFDRPKVQKKERIEKAKREGQAYCPKCGSISITHVDKKLSIGRAIVGNELAGPTGAILGGLSSKKGYAKCLNCGHKWKI